MAEADLLHHDTTRQILGAAFEVHTRLGMGFLESVYEESLAIEFRLRKLSHERQKRIDVFYKGIRAKEFICDFVVADEVIIEIKAVAKLTKIEEAQLLNYLRATGIRVGMLINFGQKSLEYKRFIV